MLRCDCQCMLYIWLHCIRHREEPNKKMEMDYFCERTHTARCREFNVPHACRAYVVCVLRCVYDALPSSCTSKMRIFRFDTHTHTHNLHACTAREHQHRSQSVLSSVRIFVCLAHTHIYNMVHTQHKHTLLACVWIHTMRHHA